MRSGLSASSARAGSAQSMRQMPPTPTVTVTPCSRTSAQKRPALKRGRSSIRQSASIVPSMMNLPAIWKKGRKL